MGRLQVCLTQQFVNNSLPPRSSQLGLSILGALLALVIGALLTVPVVNAFLDSQRKTRVEENLQDMRIIIADAQRIFGNTNRFQHLMTVTALNTGVIPDRMRSSVYGSAQTNYNGDIHFYVMSISAPYDSSMMVWDKVPRSDCADIVMGIEQLARGIYINGGYAKPVDGVIDTSVVSYACDANPFTDLQIIFGRKG